MRAWRSTAAAAALAAALAASSSARPDDGEDDASADDLTSICRLDNHGLDGRVWWPAWWFANRTAILSPSYRVPSSPDGAMGPNVAARRRARDALLAALGSKVEVVSSEAALALGRAGDARDIATLSKIVRDADIGRSRRTHRFAALGLGFLPLGDATQSADARGALIDALRAARGRHDQYSNFWQNCAWALGMRGDAAALPDLVDLRRKALAGADMQSTLHADVLGALCWPLARLGGETALPEIEEHLRGRRAPDGGSKDTSYAACHALASLRGEATRKALRAAAGAEAELVRAGAFDALGVVSDALDDETAALLRKALAEDRDGQCRQMAAVALGRMHHATSAPTLLAALESASTPDRPFVVLGLGLCARAKPDPKIDEALARRLRAGATEQLEMALCLACGLARVEAARPRLIEIASKSGAPVLQAQACFALGLLGGGAEEERRVLHEVVERRGDFVARREAALALGLLRDRSVVDRLRGVVDSEQSADIDRQVAAACLGRVGDDGDVGFLVDVLTRPSTRDQTRACVIRALGTLLDRSEGATLGQLAACSMWTTPTRGMMTEAIWDVQRLLD